MNRQSGGVPLMALNAVVLDTETTSLDPRNAWIVEIGAVRLVNGKLDRDSAYRRLVRPGEPIPPASTAVHHISDQTVKYAPTFAEVWREFLEYIGDDVLVGHTLGFDLAVFRRECERAGLDFLKPRTLDTRLLAQVAEPNLAGFTLENLSVWLGVDIVDRHSALGDAIGTAEILTALVPKLREGGIRTLGEAIQSCRALTDVLDEQHRAGWVETVDVPARVDAERTFGRIDSYAYRHRNRDIMRAPPQFVDGDRTIRDALLRMTGEQISSLFVRPPGTDGTILPTDQIGIITERDLLRAIARKDAAGLDMPVMEFASRPLATVRADTFVYRSIGRMNRIRTRHLGVVDDSGVLVGALSSRDLLRLRAGDAISLGDEIDEAEDSHALAVAWAKLPHVAAGLIDEGLAGRDIAAVISREVGALTRQAAVLAEQRMRASGAGGPPCPFALSILGSAGRGESMLAMDQDTALVFAEGAPDGPEDRWFAAYATHIADIVHEVGIPYCKGGVMAKNPQWRGSLATWRDRIAHWISRSSPEDLLSTDIFFDMRAVHGDATMAQAIWTEGFEVAKGQSAFAKLLVESAGAIESGLTFFGRFNAVGGRIDLKKYGLFGIVTAARVLAICHNIVERSTPARIEGIRALGIGGESDLAGLSEAQGVFIDLIIAQQVEDIEHGVAPSNAVVVKSLSRRNRERLRKALEASQHLEGLVRDLLFKG